MIAILIPTYQRAHKVKKLFDNIKATTTTPHNIYFLVEKEDTASIDAVESLGLKPIINQKPKTYVSAINLAFKKTKEPFIFCGADDIEFMQAWDIPVIKAFENKKIGLVGSIDSWAINQTGCHASHFTVRREYILKQGGTFDEKGTIYNSKYGHYQCDVETVHTALTRGAFYQAKDSIVEHQHYFNNKSVYDSTYDRAKIQGKNDEQTFEERRSNFEYWHYGWLWRGKKYRVNCGTLSVVLPSYNALPYLRQTINSLIANTYHNFELIIVDDSIDPATKQFLKDISESCTVIFNKTQGHCNANWNKGIQLATGDFIAVINNDITFSKHWDVPLMNGLLDSDTWIASPYQTDPTTDIPYKWDRIFKEHQHINGACWMTRKDAMNEMGPIPKQLTIWRGDTWLSYKTLFVHKKKLLHTPDCVIHHFASISSQEFNKGTGGKFYEIIKKDIEEYNVIIKAYEKTINSNPKL